MAKRIRKYLYRRTVVLHIQATTKREADRYGDETMEKVLQLAMREGLITPTYSEFTADARKANDGEA